MDVKDDFFDETFQSEGEPSSTDTAVIKLPLPPEDFDEFGQVRKLRKRMLKKLFKQEMRFYAPIIGLLSGLVILASILFSVALRAVDVVPEDADITFLTIFLFGSGIVYVYGAIGLSIFSCIYPVWRYNKNFFQSEGYLTFSVPASMEEHLFAKRIAAVLCQVVSSFAITISLLALCSILGGWEEVAVVFDNILAGFVDIFYLEPVHMTLFTVEILLLILVSSFMTPCVYGLASCLLSKTTGKKKLGTIIVLVFLLVGAVESVVMWGIELVLVPLMLIGIVGVHIALWLFVLIFAAITVVCWIFELRFLKNKMDLK